MKPQYYINKITESLNLPDESWVTSKDRTRDSSAWPKQFLMYCLRKYEGYTYSIVGSYCDRDHATAMHAKKKVENFLVYDRMFQNDYADLNESIYRDHIIEKYKNNNKNKVRFNVPKRINHRVFNRY